MRDLDYRPGENMKTQPAILKLRDTHFQGFTCDTCGRDIKHAYSINGVGSYGSECIYKAAGIDINKASKAVKGQLTLAKIWTKMVSNPKAYDLAFWTEYYGSLDAAEDSFMRNGKLGLS